MRCQLFQVSPRWSANIRLFFNLVQFKALSMRSEKPICVLLHRTFPNDAFKTAHEGTVFVLLQIQAFK